MDPVTRFALVGGLREVVVFNVGDHAYLGAYKRYYSSANHCLGVVRMSNECEQGP
jgi:hypothetical protein